MLSHFTRSQVALVGLLLAVMALPAQERRNGEPDPPKRELPGFDQNLPEHRPGQGLSCELLFISDLDFPVTVGIRTVKGARPPANVTNDVSAVYGIAQMRNVRGKDFSLPAGGTARVGIPNGSYQIYYLVHEGEEFREGAHSYHSPAGSAVLTQTERRSPTPLPAPRSNGPANGPAPERILRQGASLTLQKDNYVIALTPVRE